MPDQIAAYVREILIDAGRVTLPGFGTLVRHSAPAQMHGADRRLLPPSARITFNENLITDDGRLTSSVSSRGEVNREAAQAAVQQFVADLRQQIDSGHRAELPGVGHLFQQYDGRLLFEPVPAARLNKSAMGLPAVAFAPVRRAGNLKGEHPIGSQPRPAPTSASPASSSTAATQRGRSTPLGQRFPVMRLSREGWYAIVIILAMLALWAMYALFQSVGGTLVDDARQPARPMQERVEPVTPSAGRGARESTTVPLTAPPVDARSVTPDDPPRLGNGREHSGSGNRNGNSAERSTYPDTTVSVRPNRPTSTTPTRSLTASAGRNTAVIAIGLYGNRSNVDKNSLRLQQAGYTPWSQRTGRYTRVGIQVRYASQRELDRILTNVRTEFAEESFILQINGRRVED